MGALTAIIVGLFILAGFARLYESGAAARLWREWKSLGVATRAAVFLAVVFFTMTGGSKGPPAVNRIMRLLFWDHSLTWPLSGSARKTAEAKVANQSAAAALATVEAQTNQVCTISFDWHAPDRLPYHERQNVMAWTATVIPTNIDGTLYEDHYVAFNSAASTNPAVILIEYAGRDEAGNIVRFSAPVITNSYPDTSVVNLQSGAHTCYWFRVEVPAAFTNSVRDWNGEALFGSPEGSGKGFDLLGTLVVDDGDSVWVGANTNMVIGAQTNIVRNGIITED
jgi:hypothetical protein